MGLSGRCEVADTDESFREQRNRNESTMTWHVALVRPLKFADLSSVR